MFGDWLNIDFGDLYRFEDGGGNNFLREVGK